MSDVVVSIILFQSQSQRFKYERGRVLELNHKTHKSIVERAKSTQTHFAVFMKEMKGITASFGCTMGF